MQPGNPTVQVPPSPAPAKLERKPRTSAELREELSRAESRIQAHSDGIRRELTLADITIGERPVLDHIRRRPLLAVGATAAVFAAFMLAKHLAGRERPQIDRREDWWRMYTDDLIDDAAARVGRDGDPDAALRRALRRRAPVIYVEVPREERALAKRGALAAAVASVANTALGFGLKFAMNRFMQEIEPHLDAAASRKPTEPA
jgi:hypothetical protein